MPITLDQLPRDANGIISGTWRVVHRDPNYNGQLGMLTFVNGACDYPTWGKQLQILVAVAGHDLYLVPWSGDIPNGTPLPENMSQPTEAQMAVIEQPPTKTEPTPVSSPPEEVPHHEETGDGTELPDPFAHIPVTPEPVAEFDDLDGMNRFELKDVADSMGLKPHWKMGEKKLRKLIRDARGED